MQPTIGRHLLLTPGPTNIPEAVQRALCRNSADIGAADFVAFTRACIDDLRPLFQITGEVFAYAGNGHGAWEAALATTLAPGERVLVPGTGHFATQWALMAETLGLQVELTDSDWRSAADLDAISARLQADRERRIRAVLLVHADTATGIANDVAALRQRLDAADHPALLLLDAVATLGCSELCCDAWGVDMAIAASQKGLMAPPGLAFVAVSERLQQQLADTPPARSYYWDWRRRGRDEEWYRWFCGTAPTHLLFALRAALDLFDAEGLAAVFARHRRQARATRAAVRAWGSAGALELNARREAEAADAVTTIRVADGVDAAAVKQTCYQRFNVSLGGGLSQLYGKAFRIGHMGALDDAMLLGGLATVEATLRLCDVPYGSGGVDAAVTELVAR